MSCISWLCGWFYYHAKDIWSFHGNGNSSYTQVMLENVKCHKYTLGNSVKKNHTFIRSHGIRTLSMANTSTTHFNEILWSSARLSLYPIVHHFLHQDGDKVTGDEVKSNSHNGIFVLVISMHDIATVKWLVSILFNIVLNRQQTRYLNQRSLSLIINFSTSKMYRSWYCQCIIVLYNPFWSTQTALL